MKYKLIGMDFDGTLLTDEKKVSQKTEEFLKNEKEKGIIIVGITARTLGSAEAVVPLSLFDYIILNNGAYLYDVTRKEEHIMGKIQREVAEDIAEMVYDVSKQIEFISGTTYYIYKGKGNDTLSFIKNVTSIGEVQEEITRMNVFFENHEDVSPYYQQLSEKWKDLNIFIMQDSGSEKRWIVINPEGINKATTLERLGEKEQIGLQEMIFFGDGSNDIEVMEAVGCSVAMENALEIVKEKANFVTLSNEEDGIPYFFQKELVKRK